QDVSVFFRALSGLLDGFRERARATKALLADPATTFVIVTSPEREPVEEAIFFGGKLREAGLPFGALIVNRVQSVSGEPADEAALAAELGAPLAAKVARTYAEVALLAQRDRAAIARLRAELGGVEAVVVPQLEGDVHDVDGLVAVWRWLFGRQRYTA